MSHKKFPLYLLDDNNVDSSLPLFLYCGCKNVLSNRDLCSKCFEDILNVCPEEEDSFFYVYNVKLNDVLVHFTNTFTRCC